MKNYKIVLLALFCTCEISVAQEVESGVLNTVSIFYNEQSYEQALEINNKIVLLKGQWTDFDRTYELPRFENSMYYIVLNNRTNLLSNLLEISAYYKYLSKQPIIQSSGIKWPQTAANVTSLLQIIDIGIGGAVLLDVAAQVFRDEAEQNRIAQIIAKGISKSGNEFISGTASKKLVEDVTKNFFSPLIKGTLSINDPFLFDAQAVYREQYIILNPFYNNFNDFDKRYIVGNLAEYAAMLLAKDTTDIGLMFAKDRLYIGLSMMGYSEDKINGYISKIK